MAQWVSLVALWINVVIIGAVPHPDAPLSVAYASLPLQAKSSVPVSPPQYTIRAFGNNAYTAQPLTPSNPALLVASPNPVNPANFFSFSPAPGQPQRVVASPFQPAPQGAAIRFVPAQDNAQTQRVVSPPRNFVTFTRAPAQQQYVPAQSPSEPQPLGQRTLFVAAPLQTNDQSSAIPNQPQATVPRQFGIRTVFASPGPQANFAAQEPAAASGINAAPPQSSVRTVVVISPRQAGLQISQGDADRRVSPAPQPLKPRTVFVAAPNQANQQTLSSNPVPVGGAPAPSANLISSSQFFSRNFGNTGTVTYFVQPLAVPAGVAPTSSRGEAETEA